MGANLEVFKFATYLSIPLFAMVHYGSPDWYEVHVQPLKKNWWPKYETTNKPPKTSEELHAELQRFKDERSRRAEGGVVATKVEPTPAPVVPEKKISEWDWAAGTRRHV